VSEQGGMRSPWPGPELQQSSDLMGGGGGLLRGDFQW
jgi:hypothetical protein